MTRLIQDELKCEHEGSIPGEGARKSARTGVGRGGGRGAEKLYGLWLGGTEVS